MTMGAAEPVVAAWRCPACSQSFLSAEPGLCQQTCAYCDFSFLRLLRAPPPPPPPPAPANAIAAEARCFFHDSNVAAAACASCGRFVCALCDFELDGCHRCPACVDLAHRNQSLPSLRQSDTLFDSMALVTGWVWIVVYFTWIVALPLVAYWTIAKWRAPHNYLVPRRRWRYGAAFVGLFWLPLLLLVSLLIPR